MFELRPYTRKMSPVLYDPFRDMEELEKRFFGRPFDVFNGAHLAGFRTDIRDNGDSYALDADLPGCSKEDISLELNGDTLTIRAERHSAHEEKDNRGSYLRCERSYGKYRRDFDVSAVDTENIKAKYDNGVLHLTLPKKADQGPATKTLAIE